MGIFSFKNSSPKTVFVDSEAHQSKISCYLANIIKQPLNKAGNKPKIEKMTKNGPASKFWEFLAS